MARRYIRRPGRRITIQALAHELNELVDELKEVTDETLARGLRDRLAGYTREATPIGKTGALRAGWRTYERHKRGEQVYGIITDVTYSQVIDRGRRRLKNKRMGGSLQAKKGMVRPVKARVEKRIGDDVDATVGRIFR